VEALQIEIFLQGGSWELPLSTTMLDLCPPTLSIKLSPPQIQHGSRHTVDSVLNKFTIIVNKVKLAKQMHLLCQGTVEHYLRHMAFV
jgi:hypothetical protein